MKALENRLHLQYDHEAISAEIAKSLRQAFYADIGRYKSSSQWSVLLAVQHIRSTRTINYASPIEAIELSNDRVSYSSDPFVSINQACYSTVSVQISAMSTETDPKLLQMCPTLMAEHVIRLEAKENFKDKDLDKWKKGFDSKKDKKKYEALEKFLGGTIFYVDDKNELRLFLIAIPRGRHEYITDIRIQNLDKWVELENTELLQGPRTDAPTVGKRRQTIWDKWKIFDGLIRGLEHRLEEDDHIDIGPGVIKGNKVQWNPQRRALYDDWVSDYEVKGVMPYFPLVE